MRPSFVLALYRIALSAAAATGRSGVERTLRPRYDRFAIHPGKFDSRGKASSPLGRHMPTADGDRPGRTALAELREFLAFLRSLWGILAGVTVVFPISNLLTAVLPLLTGSERLSTVLATLFSLFAIFVVFALRHVDLNDEYGGEDSGLFIVASIWIFVGGAGVLIAYLYVRLEPLAAGLVPVLYATVFGLFA